MEWELQSWQSSCAECGREFADREEYYSALYSHDEGFERKDCCISCWGQGQRDAFSFWRARTKKAPEPPRRFVNDDVLIEFFDRLAGATDARRQRLAFIMAVLLLRKRLLRETGRRRNDNKVLWILHCRSLDKEYEIADQGLAAGETAELMQEIGQVLNLSLDGVGDRLCR